MTNKELRHSLTIVRTWMAEYPHTVYLSFAEHVAIIAGALEKRLKAEEAKEDNAIDH